MQSSPHDSIAAVHQCENSPSRHSQTLASDPRHTCFRAVREVRPLRSRQHHHPPGHHHGPLQHHDPGHGLVDHRGASRSPTHNDSEISSSTTLIAFPFANQVSYLLNARLVFVPGRHSRPAEFSLFTSIAGFGFLIGLLGGPFLIRWFGLPSVLAQFMLIGTSGPREFSLSQVPRLRPIVALQTAFVRLPSPP